MWASAAVSFRHANGHHYPGKKRQCSNNQRRLAQAEKVRNDSRYHGARCVTEIAPKAIDPYRRCPPSGMGNVSNRGKERWIYHGSSNAE